MIDAFFVNSLEKVFPDERPCGELKRFSALRGERFGFQLVVNCKAQETRVKITPPSELRDILKVFSVGLIPVNVPAKVKCRDDFLIKNGEIGEYPDLLISADFDITLNGTGYRSIWFEADIPENFPSGVGIYDFSVELPEGRATLSVEIKIINAALCEQQLICTHWFHCDCLADRYSVEVFSEEHWAIIEKYVRFAAEHGINFILTPLFTPPLDTEVGAERPTVQLVGVKAANYKYEFNFDRLDRWIDMCLDAGIKYFEMSHLFTQWGAKATPKIMAETEDGEKRIFGWDTPSDSTEYRQFIAALAAELNPYLEKKGVKDRCFFHVSDEPSEKDMQSYKKAAALINEYFGEYRCIDALSDIVFYEKGLAKLPIPSIASVDDFKGKVPELWTYYCSGPASDGYINRFLYYPSVRNRALGAALYKYDCRGFLHWGYNFWYTVLSKALVDPFKDTASGGGFPAGDGFVVYPGEGGNPLPSVRLKVFYEALQDERAFRLLEKLAGRKHALDVLDDAFADYGFNRYPEKSEDFIALRERVNAEIERYCS